MTLPIAKAIGFLVRRPVAPLFGRVLYGLPKRLGSGVSSPTLYDIFMLARTGLGGLKGPIYLYHLLAVPFRLVAQLAFEFAPRSVDNGFRQPMVLCQVVGSQIFQAYRVVASQELGRELMARVLALIGDVLLLY